MLTVTNSDASILVRLILRKLEELNAWDVIAGIDESRRLGVEEPVGEFDGRVLGKSQIKQLGTVRRRPLNDSEMLRLLFDRLHQRLIVLPAIAVALQARLGTTDIVWRVDRQFESSERSSSLESDVKDMLPKDTTEVDIAYRKINELIPELARLKRIHG